MDFIDSLRLLWRQRRTLLVGAALTLLAAVSAIFWVPTNYQAAGQVVLLLQPRASSSRTPTNPYLNLDSGLTVAASLTASALTTKEAQRSVEEAGYTSDYSIEVSPSTGPLLIVSAEDTDPIMAVNTRDEVIRRLQNELLRMQTEERAPSQQLIHTRINTAPEQADPLPGSKIRALAAIGGVGVLLTFLVAIARDRRRQASAAANPDPLPEEIPAQSHEDLSTNVRAQESEEPSIARTQLSEELSAAHSGQSMLPSVAVNGNGVNGNGFDEQQEGLRQPKANKSAADGLAG
jgi:hypothetical protein